MISRASVRVALLGASFAFAARAVAERRALRDALVDAVGPLPIETDAQLLRLHSTLRAGIDPRAIDKQARRPLLRSRAVDVWRSGAGLCGENARLAITFLDLGGVRGNRLYLRGERWDHCMAEILWRGQWVAFDGHDDETLRMTDEQVGRLPSTDLRSFPNRAPRNPWRRAVRFKPLLAAAPSVLDAARPPRTVVRMAESPDALRALVFLVAAAIVTAVEDD
ncbi:MAG: hypothetical protein QOH79_1815 [Acidimicrobiaceae bacterium]